MKYLNKIIFINSANIPYAEISVDGNVHFTGTQGVGKSTALRALLFFYNADKQRLGIGQGQKSFDEFYFRYSNSHILYEVMREGGAYTILVSRYQGHASWRFIDAPYQREWLVAEDGLVMSDWTKIRERIGGNVSLSARIDTAVMYRDIIYGNTHDHKYLRYALVNSSHYQNIPRSIQNVFLNTELDARFVKDTIIQSMEDDLPIDLQTYRRLIAGFEREYNEIDCWFKPMGKEEEPVHQLASKIAEQGRKIIAVEQQMKDTWRMLNQAVAESERQIPLLEQEEADIKTKIEKEEQREKELGSEYGKERDSLNQKFGAKKKELEEIIQARKNFDAMGIKDKLALAAREDGLKQEVVDKQMLLDGLLKTHDSIEEKYKIARGKLENARKAFENKQKDMYFQKQASLQIKREGLEKERTKNRNLLIENFNNWRRESDERLEVLQREQHRAEGEVQGLRHWRPMADEINQVVEQLHLLEVTEKENGARQLAVKSQLEQLTAKYEMRLAELEQATLREQESLEKKRKQLREQIAKIEGLLENLDGSFYQWLCQNVEGWENTIGKVVDEEQILYAQGLEPQLGEASDCMFGVKVNLDNIDFVHRTPDEYRVEKMTLEEQVRLINCQLEQLPVTLQDAIEKLRKEFKVQIQPLRQESTSLKLEEEQIPIKRQNLEIQQHKLEMDEKEAVEKEKGVRERIFNEALLKVQAEKKAREQKETENKKDLKELDSVYNRSSKALDDELREFQAEQEAEGEARIREFAIQKTQLDEQQNAELAGQGVDVRLLEHYRKEVEKLKGLLNRIEDERAAVIRYRDAEANLFSKEPDIRKDMKDIRQCLDMVQQRFEDKKSRIQKEIKGLSNRKDGLDAELKHRQDGLKEYHEAVEKEYLVPDSYFSDDTTMETKEDCQQLLLKLRGTRNLKGVTMGKLKNMVVKFNRNFKPENTFHFNTIPSTDNDYLQIAADLQDFIDNNKIEEFRQRTSEHYKDILGRISIEIGALMKRKSDIDGIIHDINRDFVEKNFAGVIKSIELKTDESSDKLMQLLRSIHVFTSENEFSIGELNLFSGDNCDEVNRKVVDYLKSLARQLQSEPNRPTVSLADAFRLQFRVKENDNDTGWVERIKNVGSDGTDILVKTMVNIMLINVFKKKAVKKSGDFIIHCMMDEIGRLHPNNIKGILQFANSRNIHLINGSPTSDNPYNYRYTYLLSKHGVKTKVEKLLKRTD